MMNTKADNQDLEQKEYLHNDSLNEQGILKPEIREDNRQETLYENKTQTTERFMVVIIYSYLGKI